MAATPRPVVILGAGINGAALARELLLNQVPVELIDHGDFASGTTSWSTRLIHGGLRYLEHGETSLVFESLAERERFLTNSPEHVAPLELLIPVKSQFTGLLASAAGFFRLPWFQSGSPSRGAWPIRAGLTMYDWLAGSQRLGHHRRLAADHWQAIGFHDDFVDVFAYFDGQIEFPELYVAALIQDAQKVAAELDVPFSLKTYHRPLLERNRFTSEPLFDFDTTRAAPFEPAAIINASGPAGDETLRQLGLPSERLFGGTRGSHLISHKPDLLEALGERGIYAEAFDGRPVFILPWNGAALIGTTDIRHDGDPEVATATDAEIDYLLQCVNSVLPDVDLNRGDITQHYSGVRPLPYVPIGSTAAIPRGHWLHEHQGTAWPCFTIVGGKLTTCRSLAEHAAEKIGQKIGVRMDRNSRDRRTYNGDAPPEIVRGRRAAYLMQHLTGVDSASDIQTLATAAIEKLHAKTLSDLIERRLMLLFDPHLSRSHLTAAATALVQAGKLSADQVEATVDQYADRLQSRFGKRLVTQ